VFLLYFCRNGTIGKGDLCHKNSIKRFYEAASCNSIAIHIILSSISLQEQKVARTTPSLISRILEQPLEAPVPTFAGLFENSRPIVKSVRTAMRIVQCSRVRNEESYVYNAFLHTRAFAKVPTRDRSLYHIKANKRLL